MKGLFENKKVLIISAIVLLVLIFSIITIILVRKNKNKKIVEDKKKIEQQNKEESNQDRIIKDREEADKKKVEEEKAKKEEEDKKKKEDEEKENQARQVNNERPKQRYWVVDRKAEPAIPAKEAVYKKIDFTNGNSLKENPRDNVTVESKAKFNADLVNEKGQILKRFVYEEGESTNVIMKSLETIKQSYDNSESLSINTYKVSEPVYRHSWTETVVKAQEGRAAIPEQGHWEYR